MKITEKAESHELTEYQELYPMAIMSELACLSPFSNMNAGARVILQCQMAKQTMGFCSYTLKYRSDNKMYQLLTPQEPVVRSNLHDSWAMDSYPIGKFKISLENFNKDLFFRTLKLFIIFKDSSKVIIFKFWTII